MNREQLRQLLLSGTVTFPGTLPGVAELELQSVGDQDVSRPLGAGDQLILVATQRPSPSVTMVRSVLVSDVRAVFIPRDASCMRFDDGAWYLGCEVATGLWSHAMELSPVLGVVYVPEACPSLLDVTTGLTAGESIQYYPPLPCDRSQNHYDASRRQGTKVAYCAPERSEDARCDDSLGAAWTPPCEIIDPYLSSSSFEFSMSQEAMFFCQDFDYGSGSDMGSSH